MNTFLRLEAAYGKDYDKEIQRQSNLIAQQTDIDFLNRFNHWLVNEAPRKFKFEYEKSLLIRMTSVSGNDFQTLREKLNYVAIEFNIFKTGAK